MEGKLKSLLIRFVVMVVGSGCEIIPKKGRGRAEPPSGRGCLMVISTRPCSLDSAGGGGSVPLACSYKDASEAKPCEGGLWS